MEQIATLTDEVAALKKGIEDLDKQVEEATTNRKEENEDYQTLMSQNSAAKELIEMAKNRMNKFYNPSMYKAPPKRELTMEEKMGYGASFVQIRMHSSGAPPPPPATFDAYSKKSGE